PPPEQFVHPGAFRTLLAKSGILHPRPPGCAEQVESSCVFGEVGVDGVFGKVTAGQDIGAPFQPVVLVLGRVESGDPGREQGQNPPQSCRGGGQRHFHVRVLVRADQHFAQPDALRLRPCSERAGQEPGTGGQVVDTLRHRTSKEGSGRGHVAPHLWGRDDACGALCPHSSTNKPIRWSRFSVRLPSCGPCMPPSRPIRCTSSCTWRRWGLNCQASGGTTCSSCPCSQFPGTGRLRDRTARTWSSVNLPCGNSPSDGSLSDNAVSNQR